MRRPRTIITCDYRLARWVNDLCYAFTAWYIAHHSVPDGLNIYLYPLREIPTPKGPALGYFMPGRRPTIGVACPRHGSFSGRCDLILHTLAHEWCEYEKWRDRIPRNHRGIDNRTDALIRRFHTWRKHESTRLD